MNLTRIARSLSLCTLLGIAAGWLIHPKQRSVEIYRPNGEMETLTGIDSIAGEGPVSGFVLDLSRVWDPLAGA